MQYIKTILTLILVLGFNLSGNSQSYIKMLKENSLYNCYDTYAGPPPHYSTLFRFSNDTTIGSDFYMQLESSPDSINWSGGYLLTEDTIKQQVHLRYNDSLYLIYDFSLEEGDTIFIFNPTCSFGPVEMIVTAVDSINLLGKYHKTLEFTGGAIDWIEGIGDIFGILAPGNQLTGTMNTIVCYYFEDILVYKNPWFTECFFHQVGLSENDIEAELVWENNIYKINSTKRILQIAVYNSIGEIIFNKENRSRQFTINMQSQKTGMYLIKLLFEDNSQKTVKIFKL